jgi:hypothetical protein
MRDISGCHDFNAANASQDIARRGHIRRHDRAAATKCFDQHETETLPISADSFTKGGDENGRGAVEGGKVALGPRPDKVDVVKNTFLRRKRSQGTLERSVTDKGKAR